MWTSHATWLNQSRSSSGRSTFVPICEQVGRWAAWLTYRITSFRFPISCCATKVTLGSATMFKSSCLAVTTLAGTLLVTGSGRAQSPSLPQPTRTVYKCIAGGKVTYTDAPWLGATRVDIEPTRGLDKSTGRELTGPDVAREKTREQIAHAVQLITGLTPGQFEVQRRRVNLSADAKAECARLDSEIAASEAQERTASTDTLPIVQRRLLAFRIRYRELRC